MRFGFTVLISTLVLTFGLPALASPHARRGPTSQHLSSKHSHQQPRAVAAPVPSIDADRATQIQTALISKGYLGGTPTGTWNPETQDALRKLQADNGWQTKFVPDSRAIIKLGLGPGSPVPDRALSGPSAGSSSTLPEADASFTAQR